MTEAWLDEVLAGINVQTNTYSAFSKYLSVEERARIIATLLPAIRQMVAAHYRPVAE